MDEDTVLREIASRQEARANLALHLLSQRFGVLAAAPAFDTERLPLGPQALCRAMRGAARALDIEHDSRLLLYRIFDRHVMQSYWRSLDRLDELLDREGILTGLTYVPVRIRPSAQPREQTATAGDGTADVAARGAAASTRGGSGQGRAVFRASDPQRPHTGGAGEPIEELDRAEEPARRRPWPTSSRPCWPRRASAAARTPSSRRAITTPSNCSGCCSATSTRRSAPTRPRPRWSSACRCRCCAWRSRTAASSCAAAT